jgi:hypothetical protein
MGWCSFAMNETLISNWRMISVQVSPRDDGRSSLIAIDALRGTGPAAIRPSDPLKLCAY